MLVISDTNLHENLKVRTIEVLEDTKFAVLDWKVELREGSTRKLADPNGNCILFPAGSKIHGEITRIKLLTGAIICY